MNHPLDELLAAEQRVLGALLLDTAAVSDACRELTVDDFTEPRHRQVFQIMLEELRWRDRLEALTLARILDQRGLLAAIGGLSYLMDLIDAAFGRDDAAVHVRLIRNAARRRSPEQKDV